MLREQEVDRMSEASSEKGKNRYWFPAKRYGWGWGPPQTWQGWAVVIVWFAAIAAATPLLMPGHRLAFFCLDHGRVFADHLLCEGRAACLAVGRSRLNI
jgi:hypothetical protein